MAVQLTGTKHHKTVITQSDYAIGNSVVNKDKNSSDSAPGGGPKKPSKTPLPETGRSAGMWKCVKRAIRICEAKFREKSDML